MKRRNIVGLLMWACVVALVMSGVAGAKVKVTYWDKWGGGGVNQADYDVVMGMINDFNQSQNEIEVEYVYLPNWKEQFIVSVAAGAPPDIIGAWNHRTAPYALNGLVQPLDTLIRTSNIPVKTIIPNFLELAKYEGKTYGLPALPSVIGYVWNKGVFAEAGVAGDAAPKTLDDLKNLDRKLAKVNSDGRIERLGFSGHHLGYWSYIWGWLDGGQFWNPATRKVTAADDQVVAGYEAVAEMVQRYDFKAYTAFKNSWGSAMTPFYEAKLASTLNGSWVAGHLLRDKPDIDYGVSALPHGPRGENFVMLETDAWFVPTGAKNPEAAMKFLAWMYKPENARKFALLRKSFSVVQSVNSSSLFREMKNPGLEAFAVLTTRFAGRSVPNMPVCDDYDKELSSARWSILDLKSPARQRLELAQTKIQAKLDAVLNK